MDFVKGRFDVLRSEIDSQTLMKLLDDYSATLDERTGIVTLPLDTPLYVIQEIADTVTKTSRAVSEINRREEWFRQIKQIKNMEDIDLSNEVSNLLSPYQRVGVYYLQFARRCILGDYMGLGKSSEAIGACDYIQAKRVLIVAKKSLITNWIREIKKFAIKGNDFQVIDSKSEIGNARFTIVSYEALMKRWENSLIDDMEFEVMIIDEASKILNRKAKRSKAVKAIARKCKYVWVLTGTLIRNRPDELWSVLSCLYPKEYTSYWRFRKRHFIERTIFGRDGKPITTEIIGLKDPDKFREEIEPYILRRGKDMLKLPPITHQTLYAGMGKQQRSMYAQMEEDLMAEIGNGQIIVASTELAKYTRLRQLCIDPRLCGGSEVGGKTEAIVEFVEDMADDYKIIIFSTFTEYLKLLYDNPGIKKYEPVLLTGGMSLRQRDRSMELFQNDDRCRVFLGNIDAAGEGLNITAGDIILFANCPWTPDIVEQAISRAHRRGRDKEVHVFYLHTIDTIEDYIEDILAEKRSYYSEVEAIREAVRRRKESRNNA